MNATVPANLLPQISALKAGWMTVGKAFQDGSEHCDGCAYCNTKGQMLPYGDGHAHEAYNVCELGQFAHDKFTDCPAWQAKQQTTEEHHD